MGDMTVLNAGFGSWIGHKLPTLRVVIVLLCSFKPQYLHHHHSRHSAQVTDSVTKYNYKPQIFI
jgi:hypothetical protein